jgi:hypothetical protein
MIQIVSSATTAEGPARRGQAAEHAEARRIAANIAKLPELLLR